ncbi:hypothetical protein TRVL_08482 [Trypanosoma vivax]|nr:hypothetical protein TRVL_08482 [Trypanosoma vivax]
MGGVRCVYNSYKVGLPKAFVGRGAKGALIRRPPSKKYEKCAATGTKTRGESYYISIENVPEKFWGNSCGKLFGSGEKFRKWYKAPSDQWLFSPRATRTTSRERERAFTTKKVKRNVSFVLTRKVPHIPVKATEL